MNVCGFISGQHALIHGNLVGAQRAHAPNGAKATERNKLRPVAFSKYDKSRPTINRLHMIKAGTQNKVAQK